MDNQKYVAVVLTATSICPLFFWLHEQGFALLGRALEVPTGKSYENQVTSDILQPLGMLSSGFNWTQDILARLARGGGVGSNHTVTHLGWSAPGGEMFASAADMGQFLNFLTSPSEDDASSSVQTRHRLLSQWRKDEWINTVRSLLPDGVSG